MERTGTAPDKARRRRWFELLCGLLLLAAVAISLLEIIGRIAWGLSYDFFIDLSVWLTVWAALLIAGPVLGEGGHISIDFLRTKLRGRSRAAIELFNALFTLAYGLVITWGGVLLVKRLYLSGSVFPRYLPIPKWIVELCVPIGMGIFSWYALRAVVLAIRRRW